MIERRVKRVTIRLRPRLDKDPADLLRAVEKALRPEEAEIIEEGEPTEQIRDEQLEAKVLSEVSVVLDKMQAREPHPPLIAGDNVLVPKRPEAVAQARAGVRQRLRELAMRGWHVTIYAVVRALADSFKH